MSNTAFCLNNLLCSPGKKKFQLDPSCCPVCGLTLRPGELDTHFVQELERLYKLSASVRGRRLSSPHARDQHLANTDGSLEARWEVGAAQLHQIPLSVREHDFQHLELNK